MVSWARRPATQAQADSKIPEGLSPRRWAGQTTDLRPGGTTSSYEAPEVNAEFAKLLGIQDGDACAPARRNQG